MTIDASIHSTMLFRLLFRTQDDRYEPEVAGSLLRGLYLLDDETAEISVRLVALNAEMWVDVN